MSDSAAYSLSSEALRFATPPYAYEYVHARPKDERWRIHDANDNAVGSASSERGAQLALHVLNSPPSKGTSDMSLAPPPLRQPHFAKITLDPSPGTLLSDVAATAQYLANDGDTEVHFRHNGWNFIARPGGDHGVMLARWECERKLPTIHQINCITSDGKGCGPVDLCQKEAK